MRDRAFEDGSLYLVTGAECSRGRTTLEVVEAAIRGGVDIVQMREKSASSADLKELGTKLALICKNSERVFIVNDDPVLAKEVGAHGVHLGQEDIKNFPISKTREILGQEGIIGLSTHSVQEAKDGMASGADYIAFGPVFPTKTKDYFIGKSGIPEVLGFSSKPVVFIGGINGENISELLSLGVRNVAMIRQLTEARDIEEASRGIKEKITRGIEKKNIITVEINGLAKDVSAGTSILRLIEDKDLVTGVVVVEHNKNIVPREMWKEVFLSGGDNVEIVNFVGGG